MGESKHDGLAIPGEVVLAHELPFTMGRFRVDPPMREVSGGGRSLTVEPRVMQVLVALGRTEGTIVTRDELIARCWGGRIVGEDSINRVISRLRNVADQLGGGFRVETITKVGYRLCTDDAASQVSDPATPGAAPRATRRTLLVAGAAAMAAGGAAVIWKKPWRHQPSGEALEMFRRGDMAQRAGIADQARQSVSYFERAVRLDPQYPAAWGALALAYTHNFEGFGEAELASLPGRIRSAAARALELEPGNADAELALACILPPFRNWSRVERDLRQVRQRHPDHWLANGRLAIFLYQVGRFDEGAALHLGVLARDPLIVLPYAAVAKARLNLGRVQEADEMLRRALERWPAHPLVWSTRYNHLLFTGRPGAAAAFVQDPDALPSGVGPEQVEQQVDLARAVDSRRPADVERNVAALREAAATEPRAAVFAAPLLALFGRLDLTFESLDRYYFDRRPPGAPPRIGPMTRRYTDYLFSPPMAEARRDPRFAQITRAIGLDGYWRASGTRPSPDFV